MTVDIARRLDVPRLLLVVNKVPHGVDRDDLVRQVERAYEAPVAAMLPLSEDVVRNASEGLFALRHPEQEWSAEIRAVAGELG